MTSTATIHTGVDSWLDQGHVNANHRSAQKLTMSDSADVRRALIHFAMPFKPGATIVTAELHLTTSGDGWDDAAVVTAKRITTPWREDRVTWANKPDVTATHSAASAAITEDAGFDIVIDVTDIVQDIADGSTHWHGFQLAVDKNGDHNLHSAESSSRGTRPYLVITWALLPDQPTDLVPSSEQVVNAESPVFTWSRMTSPDKKATQAAFMFELDTVETFDSLDYYTSGWVLDTHSQFYLLDGIDAPTLVDGTEYFWRVSVKDDAGNISEAADPVAFTRSVWTDTLTITSPSGATVAGTTPVFTWTFSPQTAFRATLEMKDPSDGSWDELEHDHSDWTTDPSQGFDLEAGVLQKLNRSYRLTVYVRDDLDRAGTPNDAAYLSAQTAEFTIDESGTVDPVTDLTVTVDTNAPSVMVRWHRDDAPDNFTLFKDGVAVVDGIDPIDAAVDAWDTDASYVAGDHVAFAGDWYIASAASDDTDDDPATNVAAWDLDADALNFELRYWGQVPGDTSTYVMKANVDGVHSASNDSVTDTIRADGLWLVAVADGTLVVFAELGGRTNRRLEIGESADVYNIVGRRAPVRVSAGVRGYEGTLQGKLGPLFGKTSNEWRDNLQKLAGRNNQEEIRIIMMGLNVPIALGKVAITPMPIAALFDVSIEVFQVGEFFDLGRSAT